MLAGISSYTFRLRSCHAVAGTSPLVLATCIIDESWTNKALKFMLATLKRLDMIDDAYKAKGLHAELDSLVTAMIRPSGFPTWGS